MSLDEVFPPRTLTASVGLHDCIQRNVCTLLIDCITTLEHQSREEIRQPKLHLLIDEHVYSPKADNENRYDRYIQGEEKIMIKHSEKKKHNKTLTMNETMKHSYS